MAEEMKPHVAQAYKDATDNLIYLEREQFQITYYTWLLLAALYILAKAGDQSAKIVLLIGVVAVGGLSTQLLLNFQSSIDRFRKRLDHIYATYFDKDEQKGLGLDATSKHASVVRVLIAACLIASAFTFFIICRLSPDA
jgi:hypothetical protein